MSLVTEVYSYRSDAPAGGDCFRARVPDGRDVRHADGRDDVARHWQREGSCQLHQGDVVPQRIYVVEPWVYYGL